MQNKNWLWVTFGAIFLLVLTNPSKEDYISWVKIKLMNSSDNGLLPIIVGVTGNAVFDNTTERKNLLTFSVYETTLGGEKIRALGVFNNFIETRAFFALFDHDATENKGKNPARLETTSKHSALPAKPSAMGAGSGSQKKQRPLEEGIQPNLSLIYSLVPGQPPALSGIKGATQLSDVSDMLNCNADIAAGTIEQIGFDKLGRTGSFLLRQYDNSLLKIEIGSSDRLCDADASWLDQLTEPKRNVIVVYVRCGVSGQVAYAQDIFDTRFIIPQPGK